MAQWHKVGDRRPGGPVRVRIRRGTRRVALASLTTVSIDLAGGNGGSGNYTAVFGTRGQLYPGGAGAAVTATYKNVSTTTVYLTAIQGCNGQLGLENGGEQGGLGLGKGGFNCATGCGGTGNGASGSGGGASAVCVGSISPTNANPSNNNCTVGATNMLMVAGGGGGGGEHGTFSGSAPGGAGGKPTLTKHYTFTNSHPNTYTATKITGIVAGHNGANASGTWGPTTLKTGLGGPATAAYHPTGTVGFQGYADGGGGGGGYTNGDGGNAGTPTAQGGGGGSSYAAVSKNEMVLQTCPTGTPAATCPSLAQTNTSAKDPLDIKWGAVGSTSTGSIRITERFAATPASLVFVAQTGAAQTTW